MSRVDLHLEKLFYGNGSGPATDLLPSHMLSVAPVAANGSYL
jgi:hypothetical protein